MAFDGFNQLRRLHGGGQAVIFRALRAGDARPVILKVLRGPRPSPEALARFRREHAERGRRGGRALPGLPRRGGARPGARRHRLGLAGPCAGRRRARGLAGAGRGRGDGGRAGAGARRGGDPQGHHPGQRDLERGHRGGPPDRLRALHPARPRGRRRARCGPARGHAELHRPRADRPRQPAPGLALGSLRPGGHPLPPAGRPAALCGRGPPGAGARAHRPGASPAPRASAGDPGEPLGHRAQAAGQGPGGSLPDRQRPARRPEAGPRGARRRPLRSGHQRPGLAASGAPGPLRPARGAGRPGRRVRALRRRPRRAGPGLGLLRHREDAAGARAAGRDRGPARDLPLREVRSVPARRALHGAPAGPGSLHRWGAHRAGGRRLPLARRPRRGAGGGAVSAGRGPAVDRAAARRPAAARPAAAERGRGPLREHDPPAGPLPRRRAPPPGDLPGRRAVGRRALDPPAAGPGDRPRGRSHPVHLRLPGQRGRPRAPADDLRRGAEVRGRRRAGALAGAAQPRRRGRAGRRRPGRRQRHRPAAGRGGLREDRRKPLLPDPAARGPGRRCGPGTGSVDEALAPRRRAAGPDGLHRQRGRVPHGPPARSGRRRAARARQGGCARPPLHPARRGARL